MGKKVRKKGYSILLALTILSTLCALATLLPAASASKASFLGYKALCPFAPWSTLLCLADAAFICAIRKRLFTTSVPEEG